MIIKDGGIPKEDFQKRFPLDQLKVFLKKHISIEKFSVDNKIGEYDIKNDAVITAPEIDHMVLTAYMAENPLQIIKNMLELVGKENSAPVISDLMKMYKQNSVKSKLNRNLGQNLENENSNVNSIYQEITPGM